ncbi:MAG: extracellular solute-binding protein [Lachnospiraceae bacterium]|nr:extracellular solute-binding protein [Lachnospiraceae bacterium]
MKKKILALAMSMLMTAGMLAGCGGTEKSDSSTESGDAKQESASAQEGTSAAGEAGEGEIKVPEEITFYVYYADSSLPRVDETMKRLKEIYPDTKVNIEHRTDGDGSVLKTRAAVGELPDIFECMGQVEEPLLKSGDLVMLDDVMEEKDFASKFFDGNLDIKKAEDGHYYAVDTVTPSPYLIYYNTEVFEKLGLEEPTNYDEFKHVVKTLAENDIIPLSLFGQEKWPGLQLYDMAVIGQGQELGIAGLESGETKITDPEYAEAAKKIEELVSMGMIGKGALNTNASQAFELLGNGQAGMLGNGTWFFNDAITGGWADHIGYFHYNPFTDAGKEQETQWHMSGGQGTRGGYAVSAKGEYAEFCKRFVLDYVYIRQQVNAENGEITALKETIEPTVERPASFADFADNVANIKSTSKFEYTFTNAEMLAALENENELLNTGSVSAEEYIADLQEALADIESE